MQIVIDENHDRVLLREYLRKVVGTSHAVLMVMKKRADGITVNGSRVTVRYVLRKGDVLRLNFADEELSGHIVPDYSLLEKIKIVYEDEYLLAVNKPPFMPSHPSLGHFGGTLANAAAAYFEKNNIKSAFRAANRLDANTSGIVLIAKDKLTAAKLGALFQSGSVKKGYSAVCEPLAQSAFSLADAAAINEILAPQGGVYEYNPLVRTGMITAPIKRRSDSIITRVCHPDGSYAATKFSLLAEARHKLMFGVYPLTGRTHQIRVHFAAIGCPLAGDFLYNEAYSAAAQRHMLHAGELVLPHPYSGRELILDQPPPPDMLNFINLFFGGTP